MRLPWPFGRSASDDGASSRSGDAGSDAPATGSPSSPSTASTMGGARVPIPPTGAWRTLPPIQRSSGPPPVVAPAAPFLADVPGHAPLPPIVTPLGPRFFCAPAYIIEYRPISIGFERMFEEASQITGSEPPFRS